jgi:hypothetical protein
MNAPIGQRITLGAKNHRLGAARTGAETNILLDRTGRAGVLTVAVGRMDQANDLIFNRRSDEYLT